MVVEGIISEQDFLAAQRLNFRPRPIFAVLGILLLMLMAYVVVELVPDSSCYVMIWLAFCLGLFFLYLPWKAKRTYRQLKALAEPVTLEARDDGLFYQRERSQGLVPWSHICKWRHNKTLLLLYPASNMYMMVPSHFFPSPEAFDEFIATVKGHLGHPA